MNNTKILEVAEDYYNKMEIVYQDALKRKDGISYYRKLMSTTSKETALYKHAPKWLIMSLESQDLYYINIIKAEASKKKRANK